MSQSSNLSWLMDSQEDDLLAMVDDGDDDEPDPSYWSDDDDTWCCDVNLQQGGGLANPPPPPQQGGAVPALPLFDFDLRPTALPRRWRNVVHKTRYRARLSQQRAPTAADDLGGELVDALSRAVQTVIASNNHRLQPHDRVHFTLQSDAFAATQNCFQSTQFTIDEVTNRSPRFDSYLTSLSTQLNSSQSFQPDDDFSLDVTTISMPARGTGKRKYNPVEATVRQIVKKTRVLIKNQDDLCCARAIVTMKAWADEQPPRSTPTYSYRTLRKGDGYQLRAAQELHQLAGVPEGPCGLDELAQFQAALPNYQIKVLRLGPPHMIVYAGPDADKRIILIQDNEHFDGCTSLAGFLNKAYFCHACNKGYAFESYQHHRCQRTYCASCLNFDCDDFISQHLPGRAFPQPTVLCSICHRHFYGQTCLSKHYNTSLNPTTRKSVCQSVYYCTSCCKTVHLEFTTSGQRKGPQHKCGWSKCEQCQHRVEISKHQCYIQPLDPKEDEPKKRKMKATDVEDRTILSEPDEDGNVYVARDPPLLVYADYEAITDPATGLQTPILLAYETEESDACIQHYGDDCTERFFDDLELLAIDSDGNDRQIITLFHNLKGYDSMFLLQHCYHTHRTIDTMISVGAKILSFTTDRLTFKDSLCFLPFPLAAFPKTFGLQELCKGYFPHLFNTRDRQDYERPLPDTSFYDPDGMSPAKKRDFQQWHATKREQNYHFVLKRDMQNYCESDVKLLKAGCQAFVTEFEKEAKFNPMLKCITIASACSRYWRKCHLQPRTVAVEPPQGWMGARTNQSHVARQWLAWRNHTLVQTHPTYPDGATADRIRTAFNGGEVRLAGLLVDGFDATTNTAYEFNGCFFHGCPTCFPKARTTTTSRKRADRTLHECYLNTQKKAKTLTDAGYTLFTMWECQWAQLVKSRQDIRDFLASLNLVSPLNPREAFFGGRTNAVCLHHAVNPDLQERILYQDVTSLYPWVNKYGTYVIGHPIIITNLAHTTDLSPYFGLAKVTILPPYHLYHPVLPFRHAGKLTFPPCATCVVHEMAKPMLERSYVCHHSVEERQLLGTWTTLELAEAVRRGYVIRHIHEVWHFPPNQQRVGLFRYYVDTWLKRKTQASGYPSWVQTPTDRTDYINTYHAREGITLDADRIEANPGEKTAAKLMLNSFWGKFAENMYKTRISSITDPSELYAALINPLINITSIRICTEDVLDVMYTDNTDEYMDNGKINIFIATLTTAQARLKLYSFLHTLQQRVLYFDTDSVIYSHVPGEAELPIGDFLGDLTNELPADDYIVEFASGGPKNYGYRTHQGKVDCKVRGFTLSNIRGHNQLNFDILKQNVLDDIQQPLASARSIPVNNPHYFTRNPATKDIHVIPRTKSYTLVFDKRVVDPATFKSYPYGYTHHDPSTTPTSWQEPMSDQEEEENPDCPCALFEGEPCPH